MFKTITQLSKETGLTRDELLRICHSKDSPAIKSSERGRWKIDEDRLKEFLKKRMGKFLLLFLVSFLMLEPVSAQAKMVTGSVSIGGLSKVVEDYYKAGHQLYTEEDLNLLADCMYTENYSNGEYIMKLTGSVVLNRVAHKDFPNTIRGVLYQKGQYSTAGKYGKVNTPESVKELARELLIGGSIAPKNVIWQAMFPQGKGIWYEKNGEYFCY